MTPPITYQRTDVQQGDSPLLAFDFSSYFTAGTSITAEASISPTGQLMLNEPLVSGLTVSIQVAASEGEVNREYLLELAARSTEGIIKRLSTIVVVLPALDIIPAPPIGTAAEAKVYRAFLREDDAFNMEADIANSDAPNYLGTPEWTYDDIGEWNAFKQGAFVENKCVDIGRPLEGGYQLTGKRVDDDNFRLKITDANGMGVDGLLQHTFIEIVVFK